MKVLVTNNTLRDIGGSETYAYTLIKELSNKGIDVHGFSPILGSLGQRLTNEGYKIINRPEKEYDLIFASHTSTIVHLREVEGLKIQTCHGMYHILEQPVIGVDKYVSISQEVYDNLKGKGYDSVIIHNGIDCERFKPTTPISNRVKKILSLSQSDELNTILKKVCERMGIQLICHNKFINPIFNIEDLINECDLVISLGRGVYESMACGRNVIVLDKRPYIQRPPIGDGLITDTNITDFIKNNCSGRFTDKVFDEKMIEEEILKYDAKYGEMNREFALQELNIVKQVDKYLNLK